MPRDRVFTVRVAALTRYDSLAASTRQRVLQYLPALAAAGIEVDYHPLLGQEYLASLVTGRGYSRAAVASAYLRRLALLMRARRYDALWVYAELFPYLPGEFEALALRSGRPVIYDFDDAFFLQYGTHPRPLVGRALTHKFERLLAGAAACCCGNAFLEEYAARFNDATVILPTVVDATRYVPMPRPLGGPAVIGWIGSPSTWRYLRDMAPLFDSVCREAPAEVAVVGAGDAAPEDVGGLSSFRFTRWTEEKEIAAVQAMDIGVMPLPDEQWARGKSGYKLIQYMACGLPVVASPVGVNCEIVRHGVNGFLASTADEWRDALSRLIASPELRRTMGTAGRRDVETRYSLAATAPRLVEVFRSLPAR